MFKVMLVEDNRSFRETIRDNLQSQFPSVDIAEARDGTEALQKLTSFGPHLIFMDLELPGESGLKLTEKIKRIHPDIIIAILTNYDTPEYREAATRIKADYFLSKISTPLGEIYALLKSVLSKKGYHENGSTDHQS